jgi:hypothetical protein
MGPDAMDFSINGSYDAYLYVVLLQLSILYLQRLDLNRRIAGEEVKAVSTVIDDYLLTTRSIAAFLNWFSWLLAIYVGEEFGLASAALFLILGFGSSVIAIVLIPPLPRTDRMAHLVSLPATIYLIRATLVAVGLEAPM